MSLEFALRKILEGEGGNPNHYLSTFSTDLLLQQRIAYKSGGNGDGQAEYIGFALPGTAETTAKWLIKKLTYDSSNRVTDIDLADNEVEFTKIWDSRATYF